MTIGEDRVRIKFNPSAETRVDILKNKSAELINLANELLEDARNDPSPGASEKARHASLAMTAFEEGAMWAVKAATHGK